MGSSARGPAVVHADQVAKIYPNGVAGLNGLNLTVRAGEIVGLLGRSGSGKTTLFRLLVGTLRPTSGRLTVLGTDIAQVRGRGLRSLRRRVAWVSQQHNLVPGLTVGHNVLLGRLGRRPIWRSLLGLVALPKSDRRAAFDVLSDLGVADKLYDRAEELSGGQQQRVAVARALVDGPELLLADEPVASVDSRTAEDVLAAFRQLNDQHGTTVLLSLHQPDLARRFCPRVVVLSAGRVVYDGPPSGLSAADLYALDEGSRHEREDSLDGQLEPQHTSPGV